jgi:hypothetical protein
MTGSSSHDWILLALRLQTLLITLNHNAMASPHTLQSLNTNPLSLFPLVSTITLSRWINRLNLHHSLTASNCSTLKVFTSHVKFSRADFFDCELPAAISYRQLPTLNWTNTSYSLLFYRLCMDPTEKNSLYCWRSLFTEPFPSNRSLMLRRGPPRKRLHSIVDGPCMLDCSQNRCLATP